MVISRPRLLAPRKEFHMRIHPGLIVLGIALAGVMTLVIASNNKPQEGAENVLQSTMAATKISDSVITATVKSALLADSHINDLDIKVETRKGKVKLSGFIENQLQIDRMMAVTRVVQGVNGIKITVITKGKPRIAGNQFGVIKIESKSKAARPVLVRAKNIDSVGILRKEERISSGVIAEKLQTDDAIEIATSIDGAHHASNVMGISE